MASVLGVPEVRFAASLTSGGGGSAGSLGLAAAAIASGQAEVCVTLMTPQQAARRLGGTAVGSAGPGLGGGGGSPYDGGGVPNDAAFIAGSGLLASGHSFALLTKRHMERYGTTRQHLAEVAPGSATIYTYTVIRHPLSTQLAEVVPYVSAIVELDGTQGAGARMQVNITDCDPEAVRIGDAVEIWFDKVSDTYAVPRARPIRP